MDFDLDINDDNLTMIRKRISFLTREVQETGDHDAREQLVMACHNYGVVLTQALTRLAWRATGEGSPASRN